MGNSNVKILAQSFKERGVDANAVAYSGATSNNIADRVPHLKSKEPGPCDPKFILLHAADLSIRAYQPVESAVREMERLVNITSETFPSSKIIVSSVPFTRNTQLNARISQLNSALGYLCMDNPQLQYLNNDRVGLHDGIHFSFRGREVIVRNTIQLMQRDWKFTDTARIPVNDSWSF